MKYCLLYSSHLFISADRNTKGNGCLSMLFAWDGCNINVLFFFFLLFQNMQTHVPFVINFLKNFDTCQDNYTKFLSHLLQSSKYVLSTENVHTEPKTTVPVLVWP